MSANRFRTTLAALLVACAGSLAAAEPATVTADQLMTAEERTEQRNRMRAARTEDERAAIRAENHQRMSERAAARGQVLTPVNPQSPGAGAGRGPGAGRNRP